MLFMLRLEPLIGRTEVAKVFFSFRAGRVVNRMGLPPQCSISSVHLCMQVICDIAVRRNLQMNANKHARYPQSGKVGDAALVWLSSFLRRTLLRNRLSNWQIVSREA